MYGKNYLIFFSRISQHSLIRETQNRIVVVAFHNQNVGRIWDEKCGDHYYTKGRTCINESHGNSERYVKQTKNRGIKIDLNN